MQYSAVYVVYYDMKHEGKNKLVDQAKISTASISFNCETPRPLEEPILYLVRNIHIARHWMNNHFTS